VIINELPYQNNKAFADSSACEMVTTRGSRRISDIRDEKDGATALRIRSNCGVTPTPGGAQQACFKLTPAEALQRPQCLALVQRSHLLTLGAQLRCFLSLRGSKR